MKPRYTVLLLAGLFIFDTLIAQQAPVCQKCCENRSCQEQAQTLAVKITDIVRILGKCSDSDTAANRQRIETLKRDNRSTYDAFFNISKAIIIFLNDQRFTDVVLCYEKGLPADPGERNNINCWLDYVNAIVTKTIFSPTEFCRGWKKRFEIAQGASSFLNKKDMAYLATIRAYLVYTFPKNREDSCGGLKKKKRDECGGKVRLMAGPAYYLRDRVSYLALSSRIAFRLPDMDIKLDAKHGLFPIGNINLFGEYTTSFGQFNYAGIGIEVELGPVGVNFTGNYNLENGKPGFLIGLIIANNKRSKK